METGLTTRARLAGRAARRAPCNASQRASTSGLERPSARLPSRFVSRAAWLVALTVLSATNARVAFGAESLAASNGGRATAQAGARSGTGATARTITIGEVEDMATSANRDIRIARAAVEGARAGVQQADTFPNPVLSYNSASFNPTGVGGGSIYSKRVDHIVRVDQTFERGGKRALRVAVANAQLDGKRLDLEEQRRETLQLARDAYIDLLLAERKIDVYGETREAYRSSLDAATKRVGAGDLARADLARLKVEVLRADTDADAADADRVRAQLALSTLLASDVDPGTLRTDGTWPSRTTDDLGARPDDVERRPDVASARRAVEAAAASIDLARSQRVRDVTVGVQVERYPGFGGTGNTVGAGVSIPLFIGDDYRGDIAHAAADREVAEETAAKVREAALADAAGARADLAVAARKLATFRGGLLDAAQEAARSADFAFTRGALGIMDVMDSRRTLLATRLDALDAEADYARALVAVDAATTRVSTGARP